MSHPNISNFFEASITRRPVVDGRHVWCIDFDEKTVVYRSTFDGSLLGTYASIRKATNGCKLVALTLATFPLHGSKRLYVGAENGTIVIADISQLNAEKITGVIVPPLREAPVVGLCVLQDEGHQNILVVGYPKVLHQHAVFAAYPQCEVKNISAVSVHIGNDNACICQDRQSPSTAYVTSQDSAVHVIEAHAKTLVTLPKAAGGGPVGAILGVGRRVWCGSSADGKVYIWDIPTRTCIAKLTDLHSPCRSLIVMHEEVLVIGANGSMAGYHAGSFKLLSTSHHSISPIREATHMGTVGAHLLWTTHSDAVTRMWLHQPNVNCTLLGVSEAPSVHDRIIEMSATILSYEESLAASRAKEETLRREIDQLVEKVETQRATIAELEDMSKRNKQTNVMQMADAQLLKEHDAFRVQMEMARTNLHRQGIALSEKSHALTLQQRLIDEMKQMATEHVDSILDLQEDLEILRAEVSRLLIQQSDYDHMKAFQAQQDEQLEAALAELRVQIDEGKRLSEELANTEEKLQILQESFLHSKEEARGLRELWNNSFNAEGDQHALVAELEHRLQVQHDVLLEKQNGANLLYDIIESKDHAIAELEEELEEIRAYLKETKRTVIQHDPPSSKPVLAAGGTPNDLGRSGNPIQSKNIKTVVVTPKEWEGSNEGLPMQSKKQAGPGGDSVPRSGTLEDMEGIISSHQQPHPRVFQTQDVLPAQMSGMLEAKEDTVWEEVTTNPSFFQTQGTRGVLRTITLDQEHIILDRLMVKKDGEKTPRDPMRTEFQHDPPSSKPVLAAGGTPSGTPNDLGRSGNDGRPIQSKNIQSMVVTPREWVGGNEGLPMQSKKQAGPGGDSVPRSGTQMSGMLEAKEETVWEEVTTHPRVFQTQGTGRTVSPRTGCTPRDLEQGGNDGLSMQGLLKLVQEKEVEIGILRGIVADRDFRIKVDAETFQRERSSVIHGIDAHVEKEISAAIISYKTKNEELERSFKIKNEEFRIKSEELERSLEAFRSAQSATNSIQQIAEKSKQESNDLGILLKESQKQVDILYEHKGKMDEELMELRKKLTEKNEAEAMVLHSQQLAEKSKLHSQQLAEKSKQECNDLRILLEESRRQVEFLSEHSERVDEELNHSQLIQNELRKKLTEKNEAEAMTLHSHAQELQRLRRANEMDAQRFQSEKQKMQTEISMLESELMKVRREAELQSQRIRFREENLQAAEEAVCRERARLAEEDLKRENKLENVVNSLQVQLESARAELHQSKKQQVRKPLETVQTPRESATPVVPTPVQTPRDTQSGKNLNRQLVVVDATCNFPSPVIAPSRASNDREDAALEMLLKNQEMTIAQQRKDLDLMHEEMSRRIRANYGS